MDERDDDFTEYVDVRWGALVKTGVLLGCSRPEAEDLAQTTLLRCYQNWPRVQRADSPDAYIYRILVNVLTKSRQRRWRGERPTERLPEASVGHADPVAEEVSVRATVRAALTRLPEPQRVAVVLRFYNDMSERQVAKITGVPVGTVKSRVSRGLALLAEQLDGAATGSSNDREGAP